MIKIVFINPSLDKYCNQIIWSTDLTKVLFGKDMTVMSKLVPMVLAALTPPEYSFSYIDEEIESVDFDKIDADLIALTAMTAQADRVYEIADTFRSRGVPVVLGGIHASVCPDDAMLHADAIMIGEGENTWVHILEDFRNKALKKVYHAKDYPPLEKLTSPRVDIIRHDRYLTYPLQATKGCPYDCEFCSIKHSSGHKYRMKPVQQVIDEIKSYEKYNKGPMKRGYFFVDDNLYVNREYTKELFTALKELNIFWQGQGTLNTAKDEEVLALMAESGCRSFKLGFESISDESLKEANKSKSNHVEEYEDAINRLIKYGIVPSGFFIFGFDSDDVSIFERTKEYVLDHQIFFPHFSILTPYPGTRLYDRINGEGRIFDRKWLSFTSLDCIFTPRQMTAEELRGGAHWTFLQTADLEVYKQQFLKFWAKGPWKTNPKLKFMEKFTLRHFGRKLMLYKEYREYGKFLYWATKQKNATDFNAIITAISQYAMANQYTNGFNPAEVRRQGVSATL